MVLLLFAYVAAGQSWQPPEPGTVLQGGRGQVTCFTHQGKSVSQMLFRVSSVQATISLHEAHHVADTLMVPQCAAHV